MAKKQIPNAYFGFESKSLDWIDFSVLDTERAPPRATSITPLASEQAIETQAASAPVPGVVFAPQDPQAAFTLGNVVVYRVGTGAAALSSAATAVFLDEYTAAGALVQSIALPTADNGANQTLTASGTATSEGLLTRSADGRYLVLTGYDAAPGTASVTGTATTTVTRVFGRVDSSGSIDTTTTTTAFSANNVRSAISSDGTGFWATGANTGVVYQSFGSSGAGTVVSSTVTNLRALELYDGQLYVSTGSGASVRIGAVGTGAPTTTGQTITNLAGLPTSGSPYQFVLLDLTAAVAGVDTLYIADDTPGTILKYSLVGGSWTSNGSISLTGVRGLIGSASGSTATLFATSGTTLGRLVDSSGYNATITGTVSTIATAGANTAFRGVAFAPLSPENQSVSISVSPTSQNEGDSGTVTYTFTVTRTGGTSGTLAFVANFVADTTNAADFGGTAPATVNGSIAAGQASTTFSVSVSGDTVIEADEGFSYTLASVTNAAANPSIDTATATATIANDDVAGSVSIADVTITEGDSGTSNAVITLTRTGGSGDFSVDYSTADSSATAGSDYTSTSGTASFVNGATTVTITVPILSDAVFEPDEFFVVNLSNVTNGGTISDNQAQVTITNDDAGPATVTVNDVSITEGDSGTTLLTFTITRSSNAGAFTVDYATADTTATEGSDYGAASGTATFTAGGALTQTVSVTINGDTNFESDETFELNLTNLASTVGSASISDAQGIGTITNDDGALVAGTVSVANVSIVEGDSGTSNAVVTLTRTGGTADFDVSYATLDGTATAGSDYTATSGTASFTGGANTVTINIPISGDRTVEANEDLSFTLSSPTGGATIGTGTATVTITNDDVAGSVSVANVTIVEGDSGPSNAVVTITRTGGSGDFTVDYATADGSATAGSDYTAASGTASFTGGANTVTISIPISGDRTVEANEDLSFTLSNPTSGATIGTGTATVTITNDDVAGSVSVANVTIVEGNSGSSNAVVTLTRTGGSGDFTVDYATANGTATTGSDYTATSGTASFTGGANTVTVSIPILGDTVFEPNETLSLILSNPTSGAVIGTGTATVTITNDDPAPTVIYSGNDTLAGSATTPLSTNAVQLLRQTSIVGQGGAGAESVAYESATGRLYVTNPVADTIDVFQIGANGSLSVVSAIALGARTGYGEVNSVAVRGGVVAIAYDTLGGTGAGHVLLFDTATLTLQKDVLVGVGPDQLTFTPDGTRILVANEAEAISSSNNPAGSISIIDLSTGAANATVAQTITFDGISVAALQAAGVAVLTSQGLNDIEPEYISVSADGTRAYVTLQEVNAVAVIDLTNTTTTSPLAIQALGGVDHNLAGNAFDPSDQDGGINLRTLDIIGLRQPDSIASFTVGGTTYFITANEGDSRVGTGITDSARLSTVTLDPTAYPNRATLQSNAVAGRLNILTQLGDTDNDGDIDQIYTLGGRGFTIFRQNADGTISTVRESGGEFEAIIARDYPALFNSNQSTAANSFDTRSDDKGPEPEGVAVGVINVGGVDRTFAFVSNERVGGIMVYDVTDPANASFVSFIPETSSDLGPEVITFISAANSPTGSPLVVTANEISGTTTVYTVAIPATVTVDDVTITEGDSGTSVLTFTVTRSNNTGAFTLNYATANGTATAGSDYVASSGTATFTAGGALTQTVSVTVNGDYLIEGNETLQINLSNLVNGSGIVSIADAQGIGTITNDDVAGSVSIADVTITESDSGSSAATLTLTRVGGSGIFSVDYATADGSATAGSDYTSTSGTATFVGGSATTTITVSISGDTTFEPDETFVVNLTNATNGGTISDNQGVVTITNDDPLPNRAPAGQDATLAIPEDASRAFAAADFGFSDVDGNSFQAVLITSLPTAGTLTLNSVAVTAGQSIPVASLPQLVFTPAANANGNGYTSFTFQVQDNGGTADGGIDLDQSPNAITFNITPVDDLPTAVADTSSAAETDTVAIAVLTNDTDIDGGPISVAAINGATATVGVPVTLSSGAVVTLNADGTLRYDPSGQFNSLVSAATAAVTGASNSSAIDSFSYALNGGSATTVTVTINGVDGPGDVLLGTPNADTLTGTAASETINALGDNDFIVGGGGNDIIDAGDGDDVVRTGSGNDMIIGGLGRDLIDAGAGNDIISGGSGLANELAGGLGDDVFIVAAIGDTIIEFANEGIDEVRTSLSVLTLAPNVESLTYTGGAAAFLGIGNSSDNIIIGGTGVDQLSGLGGNDTLNDGGGAGADTLLGGTGNDVYVIGNRGSSTIELTGEGIDEVRTTFSVFGLQNNIENLTFTDNATHGAGVGNNLDNVLTGGTGVDDLFGRDGNDTLIGGTGSANTLLGQAGNDTYIVQVVGDSVIEFANEGTDTVQTALASFTLRDNVESLVYTGTGAFTGIGSDGTDNSITGGAGDDFLSGLGGDDVLIGGSGADILLGGEGADQFRYNGGETGYDRILDFTVGVDTIALANSGFLHTLKIELIASGAPVATSANSTFLYDVNSGILSYDADGNGAGAAVQLAQLNIGLALTVSDFVFV